MDTAAAMRARWARLHPHEYDGVIPDRLPAGTLRELSRIEPLRALFAILEEWLAIVAAVLLSQHLATGWAYALAVCFIGARQHALVVIGHDAVHWRLLPDRRWNDRVANLLLWWPVLATNEAFRHFHGPHHRWIGTDRDGNIPLWRLHGDDGRLTREWTYPKTALELFLRVLWRGCGVSGIGYALVGLIRPFRVVGPVYGLVRLLVLGSAVAGFAAADRLDLLFYYWLVPLCTWFVAVNYVRLICEHSNVHSDVPAYALTRTTIPGWFDRTFIVPRNISYHLDHHMYPSVPFYRLPALHAALMRTPGFRAGAHVTRGVWRALRECVRP